MEFFVEKKTNDNFVLEEVGFKKGEVVQIYRPQNYQGPNLSIFHYKGYKVEVLENQKYNKDEIKVIILATNAIRHLKVHKNFLRRF
jgi:hypothetical protein